MHDLLIKNLQKYYSQDEIKKVLSGFSLTRKTTFRINQLKSNKIEIEKVLNEKSFKYNISPLYEQCYILDEDYVIKDGIKISIRDLDIYKLGKIYIQNISSMLPVLWLDLKEGENVLDMCAAPGGKTTMIQSITNNKTNLTACELNKIRFERLKYNVSLQGSNVYLMNIDSRLLDENLKFDKILLDAPCSGSGTININDLSYKKYFTEKLIEKSVINQKKLLNKALRLLKKGGLLVYSTCSILNCENEDIVSKIKPDEILKILPDEIYEGFFLCKKTIIS